MSKKVLIVEDNDLNRRLFSDVLSSAGYEAISTNSGSEAQKLARDERPDLILMDISLPDMDGMESAMTIHADEETCDIPVVALTACAMEGDEDYFISEGCVGYISKPVSVNGFLQYVQRYIH